MADQRTSGKGENVSAKEVEDTLYGGTVRSSKELTGLQTELLQLREKQSGLEEHEMALQAMADLVGAQA